MSAARWSSWRRRPSSTREDTVVSWLPLYHDMGLIGCAFTPPTTGAPLYLLPPDLKNPRDLAGARHPRARHLHGVAGLRLPELRPQHRRYHRHRAVLAQAGAVRRRAGAAQHHRGLRAEVRHPQHHHALLWPGRGHPGGRDLAALHAAAPRHVRQVPVGGPPVPGRVGPHHAGGPGGGSGRGRRDRGPEPGRHAGLLQQPRGHEPRALARRLAPDGRPGLPRRRGLSLRHRAGSRTSSSWAART